MAQNNTRKLRSGARWKKYYSRKEQEWQVDKLEIENQGSQKNLNSTVDFRISLTDNM